MKRTQPNPEQFTPEILEETRRLSDYSLKILRDAGYHGQRLGLSPGRVAYALRPQNPGNFFQTAASAGMKHPQGRWRVIVPARGEMPPVVFRIYGERKRISATRKEPMFIITRLEASFVEPPNCE